MTEAMTDPPPGGRLALRRALVAALVGVATAGLLWLGAAALSPLDGLDIALLVLFAVALPWTVLGFWNAVIGLLVMRLARDPVAAVFPGIATVEPGAPIVLSTAILVCIRDEDPRRVIRNLAPMLDGLARSGAAARMHVYILSDTAGGPAAAAEEAAFAALPPTSIAVTYRRRSDNAGFKAGNIRDFCETFGARHDIAVVLDADSVMPAAAVLRLVRVMQAEPRLGILQALVVGLPAQSAFARIFQFGMRLGMRSYTVGSAWWQADCGPYWGHNAALRLQPFIAHCRLPELPGGRAVLSHDQVEAVLMRRAGYAVRVLPEEDLGFEENPPTLTEFIRRDLRWCQGNMQYWRFLLMPRLTPVSRVQLVLAILMFLGSPAWMAILVLTTIGAARAPASFVHPAQGEWLLAAFLAMWFAPKIATVADVLARPDLRRGFGGGGRFLLSVAGETVFSLLLVPIQWFSHTALLLRLPFGGTPAWGAQARDAHRVPLVHAALRFWPQTLTGLASLGVLAVRNPAALPYALLIAGGLATAIPLAVISALPWLGRALARLGLGRLPEETAPPEVLRALARHA